MQKQEFLIDSSKRTLFDWKELWNYKELFYFFTWRDITIKYKQTVLGFLWAVLQPLLMMVIFTFFFGRALAIPSQNIPYPIFVFSGLLIWNMFSLGLTNAANSMVNNAAIIKKIYFPRLIIPVSAVMVALFDFFMAFILFIPLLFIFEVQITIDALWCWPLSLIIAIMATLGPGTLLSALNVKYRDFRYVIPFLVQVLFFLTPVIYPVSLIDHPLLKYLLVLSPTYAAVELFRVPLVQESVNSDFILLSVLSGVVMLITGLAFFKRTEVFFADFA